MKQPTDGPKLRALREAKGWTQECLAERTGLSPRSIQRGEQGAPLALASLARLAEIFQVTPGYFKNRTGNTKMILRTTPMTILADINDSIAYYRNLGAEIIDADMPDCAGVKIAGTPWIFVSKLLLKQHFSETTVEILAGNTVPYVYVRQFQEELLPAGAEIIEQATTDWGTQEWVVKSANHAMVFAQKQ